MAFVVIVAAVIAVALAACECDALDYKQGHDQFGEKMDPYHHPPMDQSAPEMDGTFCFESPEHPPAKGDDMKEEPPADGPVVVFDASGIPAHAPDKIGGYADAMDKKERMDDKRHSFVIFDPSMKDEHDDALFKALEAIGFQLISDFQELDGEYSLLKVTADAKDDSKLLYRFLQYVDADDTDLSNLIYDMIQGLENCSMDERCASLSREDEELMPESLDSEPEDEDDSNSSETVYVVLAAPSAVETYLCSHAFDGGASDSQ